MPDILLDTLPVGIVLTDATGSITFFNKSASIPLGGRVTGDAFGPDSGYTLHLPDGSLFPPEKLPLPLSLKHGKRNDEVEILVRHSEGTEAVILASSAPIEDEEGTIIGAIAVIQDITERKKIEKALRESEEKFRAVVENIQEIFWIRDGEKIVYISPAYEKIWGCSCESLYSNPPSFLDAVHPKDRAGLIAKHRLLVQNNDVVYNEEYRIIRPDGSIRWIWDRAFPVGIMNWKVGLSLDVTERKLMEEKLAASEERFRTSVETLLDGFAILSSVRDDRGCIVDFRYEYINEAGCRMNRRSWEEQVGLTLLELLPAHKTTGLFDEYVQVVETGQPLAKESLLYEDIYGEGRRLSRAFDVRAVKLYDGFSVAWRDVTERKLAEEMMRESEERFRTIFEEGPLGMAIVSLDYRFSKVNAQLCRMVGYDAEELITLTFPDITHPDDLEKDLQLAERLLRREVPFYKIEKRYIRKDARVIWVNLTGSIVQRPDGTLLYFIAMIEDITERKRAEEELRETARLLQEKGETLEKMNAELGTLYSLSRVISGTLDLRDLLEQSLQAIISLEMFGPERKGIIFKVEDDMLVPAASVGITEQTLEMYRGKKLGDCLCGLCTGEEKVVCTKGSLRDSRPFSLSKESPYGHVVFPLRSAERVEGMLYFYIPVGTELKERDVTLLASIGSQLGTAIATAKLYAETKDLSVHDPLTSLANRRLMEIELERSFAAAKRYEMPLSVILLDIDHFKRYNDTYGHLEGDHLLTLLAHILVREVRETDLSARYGGEEFLVMLPNIGRKGAYEAAERIRKAVAEAAGVTVSLGVASFKKNMRDKEELIRAADNALYVAKSEGRNRTKLV